MTPADEAGVSLSAAAPTTSGSSVPRPGARPVASVRDRRLAEIGVLAVVLVWAANFVIVKAAVGAFGPMTVASTRYVIAAVTLLLLLRWRTGEIRWPGRTGWRLLGLGVLGFGGYQVCWILGLLQITAGDSALIIAAAPVLTAVIAGAVGLDRLSAPKLAGALIAFAGVAIVVAAGSRLDLGASLEGDLLTLTAAVLWAIYTTMGTRMLRRVDPLQAIAWSVLGGALFLLPLGAWEVITAPPPVIRVEAVVALLYSGCLAAGIANVLVFNAIRLVGPTRVSATQLLVPAGAVILGALFLSEPVHIGQVVGGAIIVGGVALTRRPTMIPRPVRTRPGSGA